MIGFRKFLLGNKLRKIVFLGAMICLFSKAEYNQMHCNDGAVETITCNSNTEHDLFYSFTGS